MKNTLTALAAASVIAIAAVGAPSKAEARWRGGGVAAGVIGGIAAGAIIAGASRPYYGPGYGYGGGYGYYGGPAYACYWQRQRVWDGYGWRIRRVRVCG